ncbi:hypothetical protein Patl1_02938 [Pistacia atlantica]|uniref:Uncharacterized protein n=1 Tax=Pistacia atlantica TaxID=434234 RepID=A0ACC1C9C7_9ROSI|nr:hypothetical protein Patl1_02938 [Pistacia atlantica]
MSSSFFHTKIFSFLVALLHLKCLLLPVESASPSLITDKEALISFKSQLKELEPPTLLSSWSNSNYSPCNWTGVTCNEFRQRVIALNLSGFGLEGTISPHITNLSFLGSLQLQNNKLRGNLPPQIGNLFRLTVMNLSSNSLEGEIPLNISKLTKLQVLDLMSNKITGTIPEELSHLSKLQVLNLGRNSLLGEISASLSNLSSLTYLNLGTNSLSGRIPGDLGRLGNLKVLDLTINNLFGTVPSSIYNMSSLVNLALASNRLWGEIPYDIGNKLPNLLVFNYCFNNFTGKIPGSLHNLTNIQVIRMAHNLLEGTVPPGLGNLPFLQMYNIGFNRIVSSGDDGLAFITSLANSTRLNFLAVDGNALEGVISESVGNLSKVLSKLYMGSNRIYGKIPISIGRLRSLTLLNLNNNSISGGVPDVIGQLKELQYLGLAGNKISGSIPNSLGNLRKLNQIDLSGNELVGGIPTSFENFQSLLSLDLSNNRLNRSVPKEILNLPSLSTILNLSRNFLDGPLPREVGVLEKVVTIDLSDNRLSEGNQKLCMHLGCGNSQSDERLKKIYVITAVMAAMAVCFLIALVIVVRRRKTKATGTSELSNGKPQMISYSELRQATGNFNQENVIGSGSFGSVYKGYLIEGIHVAVKVLDIKRTGSWKSFLAECEALKNVRHRNLVKLITSCSSLDFRNMEFLALVYEFLKYGLGEKPSTSGDVYSFGVMLLELFTGMSPIQESFSGELNLVKWVESSFPENVMQVLDAELNNLQHQGQSINPEKQNHVLIIIIGLGLSCTKDSPDRRISIREALRSLKTAKDTLMKQAPILE